MNYFFILTTLFMVVLGTYAPVFANSSLQKGGCVIVILDDKTTVTFNFENCTSYETMNNNQVIVYDPKGHKIYDHAFVNNTIALNSLTFLSGNYLIAIRKDGCFKTAIFTP